MDKGTPASGTLRKWVDTLDRQYECGEVLAGAPKCVPALSTKTGQMRTFSWDEKRSCFAPDGLAAERACHVCFKVYTKPTQTNWLGQKMCFYCLQDMKRYIAAPFVEEAMMACEDARKLARGEEDS